MLSKLAINEYRHRPSLPSVASKRFKALGAVVQEFVRGAPVHRRHGGVGWHRHWLRQGPLLLRNALTADNYYFFGLERPSLAAARHDYIGSFRRWSWMEKLNPAHYRELTEDKLAFKCHLLERNIPVVPLLAVFGRGGEDSRWPMLDHDDEIRDWLLGHDFDHAFIKPIEGGHGAGVISLGARIDARHWHTLPQGTANLDDILTQIASMGTRRASLAEARLSNHQVINALAPGVLNTVRLLIGCRDGTPKVLAGALRVGLGDVPCDNVAAGNLITAIDLDTGHCGPAVSNVNPREQHWHHPSSGERINGLPIPHWPQTLALGLEGAAAFPFNRLMAWDIAVTETGSVIVEANDLWDSEGIQLAHDHGLLAGALGAFLHDEDRLPGLGWR